MAYNESSKKASVKYESEKLAPVTFRMKKEEKQKLQNVAEASGVSVRRYIVEAINTKAGKTIIGYSDNDKQAEE